MKPVTLKQLRQSLFQHVGTWGHPQTGSYLAQFNFVVVPNVKQWGVLNNTDGKLTNSAHIFAPSLTEVTSGITKQIQAVLVWRDDWSFRKEEDE